MDTKRDRDILNKVIKMNYKIIKNFLNSKECENLIKEAQENSNLNNYQKMHNNRFSLACSNIEFNNLCNQSETWNKLEQNLLQRIFVLL